MKFLSIETTWNYFLNETLKIKLYLIVLVIHNYIGYESKEHYHHYVIFSLLYSSTLNVSEEGSVNQ